MTEKQRVLLEKMCKLALDHEGYGEGVQLTVTFTMHTDVEFIWNGSQKFTKKCEGVWLKQYEVTRPV